MVWKSRGGWEGEAGRAAEGSGRLGVTSWELGAGDTAGGSAPWMGDGKGIAIA